MLGPLVCYGMRVTVSSVCLAHSGNVGSIQCSPNHYKLCLVSLCHSLVFSSIVYYIVGDAEAEVRRAFQLARQAAPCVLFFDELDSIVTNRQTGGGGGGGGGGSSTASVEARILATLLTEMDGVNSSQSSLDYPHHDSAEGSVGAPNNQDDSNSNSINSSNNSSAGGVIVMGATNRVDFIDAALLRKVGWSRTLNAVVNQAGMG